MIGNVINILSENFCLIIFIIAVLPFFFIESTRKTAFKILIIAVAIIAAFAITITAGFHFWGEEFLLIFPLVIIDGVVLFSIVFQIKWIIDIISIRKQGRMVNGKITMFYYTRGKCCVISYKVAEKEYECKADRVKGKWKIGMDVPIVYNKNAPDKAYVAKHDIISCLCFLVPSIIFLIGAIVFTVIMFLEI